MENEVKTISDIPLFEAIMQAGQGNIAPLQQMIDGATAERERVIQLANQHIAALSNQIEVFKVLLAQASDSYNGNGKHP